MHEGVRVQSYFYSTVWTKLMFLTQNRQIAVAG